MCIGNKLIYLPYWRWCNVANYVTPSKPCRTHAVPAQGRHDKSSCDVYYHWLSGDRDQSPDDYTFLRWRLTQLQHLCMLESALKAQYGDVRTCCPWNYTAPSVNDPQQTQSWRFISSDSPPPPSEGPPCNSTAVQNDNHVTVTGFVTGCTSLQINRVRALPLLIHSGTVLFLFNYLTRWEVEKAATMITQLIDKL